MAQTTIAPNGGILTEIFTGPDRRAVFTQMDERLDTLRAEGHQLARREPVGRNSPCPCGSRLKFKKCCAPPGIVAPYRTR